MVLYVISRQGGVGYILPQSLTRQRLSAPADPAAYAGQDGEASGHACPYRTIGET